MQWLKTCHFAWPNSDSFPCILKGSSSQVCVDFQRQEGFTTFYILVGRQQDGFFYKLPVICFYILRCFKLRNIFRTEKKRGKRAFDKPIVALISPKMTYNISYFKNERAAGCFLGY